MQYVKQRYH